MNRFYHLFHFVCLVFWDVLEWALDGILGILDCCFDVFELQLGHSWYNWQCLGYRQAVLHLIDRFNNSFHLICLILRNILEWILDRLLSIFHLSLNLLHLFISEILRRLTVLSIFQLILDVLHWIEGLLHLIIHIGFVLWDILKSGFNLFLCLRDLGLRILKFFPWNLLDDWWHLSCR